MPEQKTQSNLCACGNPLADPRAMVGGWPVCSDCYGAALRHTISVPILRLAPGSAARGFAPARSNDPTAPLLWNDHNLTPDTFRPDTDCRCGCIIQAHLWEQAAGELALKGEATESQQQHGVWLAQAERFAARPITLEEYRADLLTESKEHLAARLLETEARHESAIKAFVALQRAVVEHGQALVALSHRGVGSHDEA